MSRWPFIRNRAAAVVLHKGQLLLVHRIRQDHEYYALPGGGIDKGETPEAAAARETLEETSVTVRPLRLLYQHKYPKHGTHYYFLCEYIAGTPQLGESDEAQWHKVGHNEYHPQWFPLAKLNMVKLRPSDIRGWLLKDISEGFKPDPRLAELTRHGDWQA